jgi:hypothetical protein
MITHSQIVHDRRWKIEKSWEENSEDDDAHILKVPDFNMLK